MFRRLWKAVRKPSRSEATSTEVVPAPKHVSDDLLFPSWPPPGPREILSRRDYYKDRMRYRQYGAPKGVFDACPLFALYRLYEWIMIGHTINMRNELELFWWTRWPVASIPDPGPNGDPERYAMISCIPALLVESFNHRIDNGLRREEPSTILSLEEQLYWASTPKNYESEPSWAAKVAPVKRVFYIPHDLQYGPKLESFQDPRAEPAYRKKNILAKRPHIHFM